MSVTVCELSEPAGGSGSSDGDAVANFEGGVVLSTSTRVPPLATPAAAIVARHFAVSL